VAGLGVNVDHVATVRQARRTVEPDPVHAALEAQLAGADGITVHLREDRRHIQDRDVRLIRDVCRVKMNLEMAATPEMLAIAADTRPEQATLVPEKREEVTTEGGLDVVTGYKRVEEAVAALKGAGIVASLFIDPENAQIDAAAATGADAVEIHTGRYAEAIDDAGRARELEAVARAVEAGRAAGLVVHAGHGLTYHNVIPVARIPGISELNIGHSIVSRALLVGMRQAVRDMLYLVR